MASHNQSIMLHVIKITDVKQKQAGRKKTMKAHLADKVL